ncbi:hypothetical protein Anapl_01331 [Anas platyrhynchos]|uniref:Uncharacterized protein n=1 Tax=Anas platyrhynchos TaxID=8839 RepID=R0LUP4_ANAPL|nr:hypothetical protein Anapl_01331 [Anas platyrhynchos]
MDMEMAAGHSGNTHKASARIGLESERCPLQHFYQLQSHTHKDCTAGQQLSLMAANQATKLLTGTNGAQRRHRAQGAFNSGKRGAKGLDVSQHRAAPCTETCCPCLPTLQLTRGRREQVSVKFK